MTWEMDPDNRPSPSDFADEMREEEFQEWCRDYQKDPDEQESAGDYEDYYEHQDRIYREQP